MRRSARLLLLISIVSVFALFSQCNKHEETETYWYPLRFITESYPPFNYIGPDGMTGLGGDCSPGPKGTPWLSRPAMP
jgi:hypothetical protein